MKLLFFLSLMLLVSCKNSTSNISDGNAVGDAKKESPEFKQEMKDLRIFNQKFELEDGEVISFINCTSHNSVCDLEFKFTGNDTDPLNDIVCFGEGVSNIGEDYNGNVLRIMNLSGDSPACDSVPNSFKYEIVECQGYAQENFICGSGSNLFDLILYDDY